MISIHGSDPTLSPRQLALAIGVSESSVKRWIDAGRVPARLTSGGHRRIELLPALRFIRDSGRKLDALGALGLDPELESILTDPAALEERAFELLVAGESEPFARLLIGALAARSIEPVQLFDGPLRRVMARIGELWDGDQGGIYYEHRATQILLRALDQLDALFEPPGDRLIAVGGSIDGDPSTIPTRMAATVLACEGVYPVNLGADTPAAAFLDAAEQLGARLVWVSVSYVSDAQRQGEALDWLVHELAQREISCMLGGREIGELQLSAPARARVGRDMAELAALARRLAEEQDR